MSWIQVRFHCAAAMPQPQQEALEDALLEVGAVSVTYQDAGDQPILEPGVNETPLWDELILSALFNADINVVATLILLEAVYGSELPSHKVEILEDKDWIREWMDSYKPMQFGSRLWICPSWCEVPDKNAVTIMLDPGLAFGTGTHATTAMCLQQLDQMDVKGKTVIDYGCGSGILAIAALLLGAKSVVCVDTDPQALKTTLENAQRNGISEDRLQVYLPDEEPQHAVDLVLANILAGPLVELAPKLMSLTACGGELILSGLLNEQREVIVEAYGEIQFEVFKTENEWLCLQGRKKSL